MKITQNKTAHSLQRCYCIFITILQLFNDKCHSLMQQRISRHIGKHAYEQDSFELESSNRPGTGLGHCVFFSKSTVEELDTAQ